MSGQCSFELCYVVSRALGTQNSDFYLHSNPRKQHSNDCIGFTSCAKARLLKLNYGSSAKSSPSPRLLSDSVTPWTVAGWAPLSMGFSRQEYWRGSPCPCPRIFLTQGSNPILLHCRQILYPLNHQGSSVRVTVAIYGTALLCLVLC